MVLYGNGGLTLQVPWTDRNTLLPASLGVAEAVIKLDVGGHLPYHGKRRYKLDQPEILPPYIKLFAMTICWTSEVPS